MRKIFRDKLEPPTTYVSPFSNVKGLDFGEAFMVWTMDLLRFENDLIVSKLTETDTEGTFGG